MLRATHKFGRLEALGTYGTAGRLNDAADPIALDVVVTLKTDITKVVETQSLNALAHGVPKPFKLAEGLWAVDLNERFYSPDLVYVVNWRYQMTPGNDKVDRDEFRYVDPAMPAREAGNCTIFGCATDMVGMPIPNIDIIAETYRDVVTMTTRTDQRSLRTDLFGNWRVELRQGSIVRFVLGDVAKVIKVPDTNRASLASVPELQPKDVGRKDRFGYAFP